MSSYFSLPSFARAKQNKEDLEKKNPQNPVLKDEDEQFLQKQISHDPASEAAQNVPSSKITESGEEKEVSKEETEQAGTGADQVAVPEVKPDAGAQASEDGDEPSKQNEDDAAAEPKQEEPTPESTDDTAAPESKQDVAVDGADEENAEDPPELAPEESTEKAQPTTEKAKKTKKNKGLDLPSQEEAEAATKGFNVDGSSKADQADGQQGEKRSWASYLPSIGTGAKKQSAGDGKAQTGDEKPAPEQKAGEQAAGGDKPAAEQKEGEHSEQGQQRTWAGYASSAYSSLPAMPSLPNWRSKDSNAEPVYNEDGTVNEEKSKEKQESEVSVLLDKLDMSSINNRVFAFSGETQKIYERFAVVLKDTMNGGPTAYEDMEKLMKDAGPQLEKQFAAMPPFVQTLVKSLPAKFGTTLGPELLAAASAKPGADMQARMTAASKQKSSGDSSISAADTSEKSGEEGEKKKRKIPGLKGLVSQQGMVASILRNVVTFIQTRFPFLASSMNVVMSLSVFSKSLTDFLVAAHC